MNSMLVSPLFKVSPNGPVASKMAHWCTCVRASWMVPVGRTVSFQR